MSTRRLLARTHRRSIGRLVMIVLVLVIGVLAVGLARPAVGAPLHPPDVHNGAPHRAPGPTSLAEAATLQGASLLGLGVHSSSRIATDSGIHPTPVELEPPDHPPR